VLTENTDVNLAEKFRASPGPEVFVFTINVDLEIMKMEKEKYV